ncbi:polysaccharide deacetylase [Flavobacterium album]|uniref:Polysaccharide deacetylase n=1 Tax=Flavobacterium album TaxID=2175091 RepID=A0A2S1R210_9FLAO|nr:polysaccharide deacetylase [Flavobacterium album]AWH86619.1 polysaccharide deacetylase [Flavobacterium album]
MKSTYRLMPRIFHSFIIAVVILTGNLAGAQETIGNYKAFYGYGKYGTRDLIFLRKFTRNSIESYLAVDPQALETQMVPSKNIVASPLNWSELLSKYKDTPYVKAILTAKKQSFALQDAGIIHGFPKEHGVTLTIDLCPSHKPLDRIVFTSLITEFQKIEKPVPVALSVSGKFMLTHAEDIQWLKGLVTSGDITITWVNHTYNHHFDPKIPLKDNFLLEPGTDLDFEILGTEISMLERGLLPSVFFRFPGLVSDNAIVGRVTGYGLIPVGSDAWLAKGQHAQAGSIVLIHGNGNEPVGVEDFIALLRSQKNAVLAKQWLLYDLREAVDDEFKE